MRNEFLSKVFRWFSLGLLITFITAYIVSTNIYILALVFSKIGYITIFLAEIFLAVWLSTRIYRMKSSTAKALYIGYSALTGLTLSSIFVVYEIASIIWIFLASAIIFLIFSFIGKRVDIDLSKWGIYLLVILLSSIILEVINIFILNETLDMMLCVIVLGIFVSYVAYDIQKILKFYEPSENMAIYGSFDLYLDFINIFLRLLRLFGKAKD